MTREPKFRGTITYSRQPLAGLTVYREGERGSGKPEPTLEELLDELERDEIRGARKALLLSSLREKIGSSSKEGAATTSQLNPKRYLVDQETGKIDVSEEDGEYTYKDALLVSASIRGKNSQGWSTKDIMDLLDKANAKRGEGAVAKVYAAVQTDQGLALQEVTPGTPLNLNPPGGGKDQPMLIIDQDGIVQEMKPGLRVGVKSAGGAPPPQKITLVRQTDKGMVKEEYPSGEVIILNNPAPGGGGAPPILMPTFNADGTLAKDKDGNPVYGNADQMLKWYGFWNDQRRADERNQMLGSLTKTIRENFSDILAAAKAVTEEAKKERGGTGASAEKPRGYRCGECGTLFGIPDVEYVAVDCPKCKHRYTKAEIEAA